MPSGLWDGLIRLQGVYTGILVLLVFITLGFTIIVHRKDEEKRTKGIKALLIIMAAVFIISIAPFISKNINNATATFSKGMGSGSNSSYIVGNTSQEKIKVGFIERCAIDLCELVVNSLKFLRDWIIGEDISIQKILYNEKYNPLFNLNVNIRGESVNLYNAMFSITGIIVYMFVLRTGYSLLKASQDENELGDVRESVMNWFLIPVYIAIAPIFFVVLAGLSGAATWAVDGIDFGNSYSSVFSMNAYEYGLGISIAKIYAFFLEFKVWMFMLLRKFVLNAFYILTPIAIALIGHRKEFDSFNVWLDVVIKFLFYPFYYIVGFIIANVILISLPNGDNPIVVIIVFGMWFQVTELIASLFAVKRSVQQRSSGNPIGLGGMVAMSSYAMVTAFRGKNSGGAGGAHAGGKQGSGGEKGPSPASNTVIGGALSFVKNSISSNAKNMVNMLGLSKGLTEKVKAGSGIGGNIGRGFGEAISKPARFVVGAAAGLVATAATGNPAAGISAAAAASNITNAIGGSIIKTTEGIGKVAGATTGAAAHAMKNVFASSDHKFNNRR